MISVFTRSEPGQDLVDTCWKFLRMKIKPAHSGDLVDTCLKLFYDYQKKFYRTIAELFFLYHRLFKPALKENKVFKKINEGRTVSIGIIIESSIQKPLR
jgi:hypothetical protein